MRKSQKTKTYAEFQQLLSVAKILSANGDAEGADRLLNEASDAYPPRPYWRMWAGEGRNPHEEWMQASAQHYWVVAATGAKTQAAPVRSRAAFLTSKEKTS